MRLKYVCAALVGLTALSACTGRSGKQVQVEQKPEVSAGGRTGADAGAGAGVEAGKTGTGQTVNESEVPVVLNEQELKSKYSIDTSNLRYKFSYLTVVQEDKIVFDQGKARLTFKNLPSEQAGTLTLEISEGSTVKLRGSVQNVVLKRGQNNQVNLTLSDPNNPGSGNTSTTDLTIDVTLDNPSSGGNNPPPPSNPPPSNPPPSNPPPSNPPPSNPPPSNPPPPPADPVSDWDGKSFKGNARWNIVPVN